MATFGQPDIQRLISLGYSIAAGFLGRIFVQYRAQGSTGTMLSRTNIVQELYLAFDRDHNFGFVQPQDYNASKYYALVDLTLVQVGDYFWNYNDLTFFVSWIEPLRPAELTLCNRTITLYRPAASIAVDNGYGGDVAPITILTDWPVSLLPGTKGEANEARTPGSIRAPWGELKLPAVAGITIEEYDLVIDDLGRRFICSQVSLAKEGFFCTMALENA